jgi:hypothetical protein
MEAPKWSQAVEEADWIAERLNPFGECVASVVPRGFEAYARVLHPAEVPHRGHGRLVRWREVSVWSGLLLGPDSQFHSIALPPIRPTTDAPWRGQGPRNGSLFPADAEALAQILRTWTSTPDHCWFCLWDGYGWGNTTRLATSDGSPGLRLPDPIPETVRRGRRVQLPNRQYFLCSGPVEAVVATGPLTSSDQTPNLWWPADRAWCGASEIDLAWTYVGGPGGMIERVLASEDIEALPVGPEDALNRVEDWVTRWVNEAVGDLWASGEATITTSRGTLYVSLHRPGKRRRRGMLQTASVGDNGVHGHRNHYLGPADEQDLRDTVESYLIADVISLVGG